MKKAERKHIVLVLITAVLIALLADAAESREKKPVFPENTQTRQQERNAEARKAEITPSIVQLSCGGLRGSGVIWSVGKENILILTNKHVLLQSDLCDVTFWQGEYYSGKVAYLSGKHDIGVVSIARDKMDPNDAAALRSVKRSQKEGGDTKPGDNLYLYGSADYVAGNYITAELEQPSVYLEDVQDEMLTGSLKKEDTGAETDMLQNGQLKDGMSGSGVFDDQACLAGLLSGGNNAGQFAAVPVRTILQDEKNWSHSDEMHP